MVDVIPQPPKAALPHKMPPMVKAMWAVCVLLAVATVGFLVWPHGGASDGAWGKLNTGSPMASAPTLLPNHDFEKEGAQGWAHRWLWFRRGPAQLAKLLQKHFRILGDRLQERRRERHPADALQKDSAVHYIAPTARVRN